MMLMSLITHSSRREKRKKKKEGGGRGKSVLGERKMERNGSVEEKKKRHEPRFQKAQACPFLTAFPTVAE